MIFTVCVVQSQIGSLTHLTMKRTRRLVEESFLEILSEYGH